MLNDTAYNLIASLLEAFMWDGELVGEDNLEAGPGVIVANHMGAIGPVALCCSLPMRLYPWALGTTMDVHEAPEKVRLEFVEPVLKLKPPLSTALAHALCKISIPLLHSIGCIPVPASHESQQATFQSSLQRLGQGRFLLIVPEDPNGEPDLLTGIRPFKRGFLRLGELFAAETGQGLPFYPTVVHEAGLVKVAKPFIYNPFADARMERRRLVRMLEETIKYMHREISAQELVQPIMVSHQ